MVQQSRKKQTTLGGVILAALIALYGYARPSLNDHFQWNLPPLPGASEHSDDNRSTQGLAKAKPSSDSAPAASATIMASLESTEAKPAAKPGPLAGRVPKPSTTTDKTSTIDRIATSDKPVAPDKAVMPGKVAAAKETASKETPQTEDTNSLRFGLLKDLGDQRYVSPAGLLYTRGGAEGHRLDHLERHTEDDPGRPGKHGVFDGGMPGALKTIDRAFERAKTGQKTTKELDEGRVIYTVDMGGRVGYIGGQDGNRQRKPMARRVRIVLDQQRVITAYPL